MVVNRRRGGEHFDRMVSDLLAATRDPDDKSKIAPADRTAMITRSDRDIKIMTLGDIAQVLIAAGWRPPSR